MKSYQIFKHPVKILAWTVGLLLVLFLAMETWRASVKPSQENRNAITEQQLNDAANLFHDQQQQLIQQTQELARRLEGQLLRDASQQQLYTTINSYPDFWGTTLFEEHEPLVWNKFALALSQEDIQQHSTGNDISVNVKKENNVLHWEFNTDFSVQKDTNNVVSYHLTTLARIEQSIALSIGSNSEYSLADHLFKTSESIAFTFFNALPANTVAYRILSIPPQDSSGVVYARSADIETALSSWEDNNWFWRSLFIVFCFVCLSLVFSRWSTFASASAGLLFQLALIAIGWFVFYLLDIPSRWIPEMISDGISQETLSSFLQLGNYIKDGLFLFLIALALHFKLKEESFEIEESRFLSALFVGLLTGIGNLSVILAGISSSYNLIAQNAIPLLDLSILPSSLTVLFYLGIGITFYALGLALVSINRFVLHSGRNFRKVILAVIAISFLLSLILAQLVVPDTIKLNWASLTAVMCFIFIYGITLSYIHKPEILRAMSVLRATVIICTLIGIAAIPIIYQGYLSRQDTSLQREAELFAQEEDSYARNLTADILSELHQTLQDITPEDLEERASFIEADFTSTIQSIVLEEPSSYSLDLQLIDPNGELIANYSTNLNSPNWVNVYDIRRLSIAMEMEQISKNAIRPVVQRPELRNQDQYETFYRGWIPIFGEEEDDAIAWILCSVFKERPNFDKPIRAVMASLNYDNWENSFLLQDYRNNTLYSSSRKGIQGQYPTYNKLRSVEQAALEQDSLFYYTSSYEGRNYRHFLWNRDFNRTIKSSSIIPDYRNILFSFFRLSFTLIFTASIILAILHFSKLKQFSFLGNYQKFQDRILDNFILATLLFLILLIIATHFAIRQQNRDIVEQELFEKLESLTRTTETASLFGQNTQQEPISALDEWVAPLNVDAAYYADRMVSESTTAQIYQQHLIPEALPFPVFNSLYEVQQRNALTNLKLGEQELLIGYRSILNAEGEPQSAVAIPTFAESPKYNQQLLEITSYLIVLYLIVFGLFILGTSFISRQLSKPLSIIQKGLDKISRGNLDTKIPVTSNDEIGQLAEAYNTMVQQLKELQKELAVAEREAAWKEMAQQVAHEIKNPLTPMKLNIQHLERQLKADEIDPEKLKLQVKQITQNLIEQIQSLNNIASDFSRFSKPLDEEFTEVSINNILKSVSNLYNNDDQITLELRLSKNDIIVPGVPNELRRVFINLVKNAFEAMPEGGTITLRSYIQKQSAFVEVEDNGIGISEEDKTKIFVPNFSTKSSGTGLGLAITKKVIEAHEGSISFASIKDKGTTFIVKLPLKNHA